MPLRDEPKDRKGGVSGRVISVLVVVAMVFLGSVFYLIARSTEAPAAKAPTHAF